MKTIISMCAALLIMFASSVSVHCQDDSLVEGMKTIDGNVISVDIQNSQIVIETSEVMTFSVPSDANIVNADGFGIQLSDVGVGDYVTVNYSNDKSGNHIMKGMEVEYNR